MNEVQTYYVLLNVDNWVTLAKVKAENAADAMQFAEDNYCKKRYEGTSVPCYPAGVFTEEMYNSKYPYALIVVEDGRGNIVDEMLPSLDEWNYSDHFEEIINETKREYKGYRVSGSVVHLTEVEHDIVEFYRIERGFDLERSVRLAQKDAQNIADLTR